MIIITCGIVEPPEKNEGENKKKCAVKQDSKSVPAVAGPEIYANL